MKLATSVLAFALAAAPAAVLAQGAPSAAASDSTLVVSGDATVQHDADLARVSAEIVTNDDNASHSAAKNATIYEALVARLARLGIAKAAIRTTSLNVRFFARPERPLSPGEPRQRYGFVTARSLSIAVTPIEGAGKIVDASLAAGVTQVGDVSFDLKDRKAAYREALAAAFADARANATALVAKSEVRLVRIRDIAAGSYAFGPPRPFAGGAMRMSAVAALPPTEIEPGGPIDVSAHVTVTYVIRSQ